MSGNVIEVDVLQSWWDYVLDVATIVLTCINVWLIYIIYRWQNKDSNAIEERQRKVNQFNNVFLVPRMDHVKKLFDDITSTSFEFETIMDDEEKKEKVYGEIEEKIISFDGEFVSFIAGIDSDLFENVHELVESMRDDLSQYIFDTDTKSVSGAVFVQSIQKRINDCYKALLSVLFNYDGKKVEKKEKSHRGVKHLFIFGGGIVIIILGLIVFRNLRITKESEIVVVSPESAQMGASDDNVQIDSLVIE